MNNTAIIASTDKGVELGLRIQKEFSKSVLVSTRLNNIASIASFLEKDFARFDTLVFIGALGICVRSIAPYLTDKQQDPAVINMDDHGTFVQSVVSGHVGGANELASKLANAIGALPVITTSSDIQQLWALDTLAAQFNWKAGSDLNQVISLFVNNKPTALLLDIKDKGTQYLEKSKPSFVDCYYDYQQIDFSKYALFIAVTYKTYVAPIPSLYYYAPVLNIGMGCSRDIESDLLLDSFRFQLAQRHLAIQSVKALGSIDVKHDEAAFIDLSSQLNIPFITYTADELNTRPLYT
jgi:cobalamin biosynthesis protein CbiG